MHMPRALLAIAIVLSTMPSCTREVDGPPGYVTRDSAGITIVENDHTRPLWRMEEAWRIAPAPLMQIGSVEDDSAYVLHRPWHARRLSHGPIAVVNNGTAQIRLFDANGRHVRSLGRRGDGPGEFRDPWKVHELPGDSLLVIDLYGPISIFRPDGEFVRRFRLARPNEAFGHGPEPVDQFGDGTLLFRRQFGEEPNWRGVRRNRITMVRHGLDGEVRGSLGEFDDQTVLYNANGFYRFGAWAKEASADSSMWYGPGDRFELREIALDGRLKRLIRLDRPNRPVTERDRNLSRDSALARYRGTRQEAAYNQMLANTQYAAAFPAHFELMVDALGNLWVQDYQQFQLRIPRLWSVFDSAGRFLGDVEMPGGFRLYQIGADFVLGRWQDDLDVEYIRVHRIEKPAPRAAARD
ncbi:MAG: hypothetical protein ACRENP_19750 [Longimicrobiales bacterium]